LILYRLIAARIVATASQPARTVIVAARALPIGTIIKDTDIRVAAWPAAVPLARSPQKIPTASVRTWLGHEAQIEAHRTKLCELAPREAHELAAHVAGLSLPQAAALFVGIGDKTFENRDQLVAFVGLDVKTRQSGKWVGKQILSKRGNGYLRKILFQLGWSLTMNNERYHEYYQRMKARGKPGKTCIIAVARKFLRFLFAYFWKKSIDLSHASLEPRLQFKTSRLANVTASVSPVPILAAV
jgi:hypothetical protein